MNDCSKAVLNTISFFDVMDYPMTSFEIWKWLYSPDAEYSYAETQQAIDFLVKNGVLSRRELFYMLSERTGLVRKRKERYLIAHEKYKKALKSIRLIAKIPWVRGIAVCNNLAFSNASEDADIDLFVLVDSGHIWKTRLFASGLMALLGRRPQPNQKKDSICLSFYITPEAYDLSAIAIEDDMYLMYWVAGLVPVYDRDSSFAHFFEANTWVKKNLPHWEFAKASSRRTITTSRFFRGVYGERYLETYAMKLQRKRFHHGLLAASQKSDNSVFLNEHMLKMHVVDARRDYRDMYLSRMDRY